MGKLLIIVSVVISLLTAALGFVNHGKMADAKATLASTQTTLDGTKKDLTKAQGDLKTANANLASVTTEKEQVSAQLTTAQNDVTAAKKDLSDAQAQVTSLTTDKTTIQASLDAMTKERDEAIAKNGSGPAPAAGPSADTLAQLEEQKTLITKLNSDLADARGKLESAEKDKAARAANALRPGVEGRILAVNPAWNFVVLSLGDKNGVSSNTELLVKRGNQLVGKIRVTSVEPSTSIADIVANSVPNGTAISPGDHVIYKSAE